jgi:hypothetical protein
MLVSGNKSAGYYNNKQGKKEFHIKESMGYF